MIKIFEITQQILKILQKSSLYWRWHPSFMTTVV